MISPGGIADLIFGIGISAKQPVYFGNINAETLPVNGSSFGIIRGRSYLSQFFGKTKAADIMCAFSRFFLRGFAVRTQLAAILFRHFFRRFGNNFLDRIKGKRL